MIRHESVITGLIGAALGIPLGLVLAALVTRALSKYDVQFSVPTGALVVFTIVAVTAGVVSAGLASTSGGTAQRPQGAPVRVNKPRRGGGWNAASLRARLANNKEPPRRLALVQQ
jgi:hypothetical protein